LGKKRSKTKQARASVTRVDSNATYNRVHQIPDTTPLDYPGKERNEKLAEPQPGLSSFKVPYLIKQVERLIFPKVSALTLGRLYLNRARVAAADCVGGFCVAA